MVTTKFDAQIYERDIYQDTVYSAWLKNSNERDVLEQVLRDHFSWWAEDRMSILDIGCGTGSAARRVFNLLTERGFSYQYTGVDPYEDQLTRFREDFQGNASVELVCSGVEEASFIEHYDFAMIVHALYYVDSLEKMLEKITASATKTFIVHHGKFGINEVHERFRSYVKPGAHIISTWEDVQKALDGLGIAYKLEVRDTEVNVSSCQQEGNKEGEQLIKFFLEQSNPPDSVVSEVRAWLASRPGVMKQDVGYFFIG